MKTKFTQEDFKTIHKEARGFRIRKIQETIHRMKEGKEVPEMDLNIIRVWGGLYGRED